MTWERDLKLKQVDELINNLRPEKRIMRPKIGWLKLIRTTLGMSAHALGCRIGLTQSRVALIEKGEVNGSITLNTLQKVADGLECDVVYFLLPKEKSLDEMRKKQAHKKALKLDTYAEQQMSLEDQATSVKYQRESIEKLKEEYLKNWSRDLWDK